MKTLPVKLIQYLLNREYVLFFCVLSFPLLVFLYVFNDLFPCYKTMRLSFFIRNNTCYVWEVTTFI
jgi:hypothetical protein